MSRLNQKWTCSTSLGEQTFYPERHLDILQLEQGYQEIVCSEAKPAHIEVIKFGFIFYMYVGNLNVKKMESGVITNIEGASTFQNI
jgi:hypothetical protein